MIYLAIIVGYLFGSIPFALIIGKVFYKKDIRNFGSGNLGGTNAGRVLGAPAGVMVSVLDALKGFVAIMLAHYFIPGDVNAAVLAGFAAAIGHCYPLFANFRGGKAVSTAYGYLLGIAVFFMFPWGILWVFALPLATFFLILKLTKFVSFSSMISVTLATIIMFILQKNLLICFTVLAIDLLVIYRHRANIKRLADGKESKVKWL